MPGHSPENIQTRDKPRPSFALRHLARALAAITHGRLTLIDANGAQLVLIGPKPGAEAIWHLKRPWRTLWRLWQRGDIGFAEGYMAGDWITPDLHALLQFTMDNEGPLTQAAAPRTWQRSLDRFQHWMRRNHRANSKSNIERHYDLGNEFYHHWLDRSMSYSAALFSRGDEALESAQQRKYERLLDRLEAKPGAHILEIGCGWGGFAEAAARRGFRVTGITLSREQLTYARDRIARAGLSEQVQLHLQDYRDVAGDYDHIVSIEMFEAVGEQWWPTFFQTLFARLRPGGRAALQVITIDEAAFQRYRRSADFIQLYIFPGGMLPPVGVFHELGEKAGLICLESAFFGQDYALTLRRWFDEVRRSSDIFSALGYSASFLQMWKYYLAYCEVGFNTARIDLMQTILEKPHPRVDPSLSGG